MPIKKGSGSLDFTGEDDGDNADEPTTDETRELSDIDSSESGDTDREDESNATEPETDADDQQDQEFLYFVRRSKAGDERGERIEVWFRDDVLEEEGTLRGKLANALGEGGEISKTNAREFTLKYAFENPEDVAELMREEGYGLTD